MNPAAGNVELDISLEPHLLQALVPLKMGLPTELAAELNVYIADPPPRTIPYTLLASISKWSRSQPGRAALDSHKPPLRAQDYSMVALLAGTVTSPDRKFPAVVPPSVLSERDRKREITDRKAIATLVNVLVSIAGSGVATWLVAERWKYEWRVLLSFLVAVIVAISEVILYIIWQSRQSRKMTARPRLAPSLHKKHDGAQQLSRNKEMGQGNLPTPGENQVIRKRLPSALPGDE